MLLFCSRMPTLKWGQTKIAIIHVVLHVVFCACVFFYSLNNSDTDFNIAKTLGFLCSLEVYKTITVNAFLGTLLCVHNSYKWMIRTTIITPFHWYTDTTNVFLLSCLQIYKTTESAYRYTRHIVVCTGSVTCDIHSLFTYSMWLWVALSLNMTY